MPKKNPKHQARIERQQVLTKRGKRVYNWRKIGGILVVCGAITGFVILGIIYGPAIAAAGRTIKDGDGVFIYYKLYLGDGTIKDQSQSATGTYFEITHESVIPGFYDAVIGMHVGQVKDNIIIEACPSHNCPNYKGYTTGELAYVYLKFYVKIVGFAD
ncbi:MAG: hypothetical protein RBG13Loki_1806 [Promethearchaeota archaeon CR_4]|nr:MAG: hypothetical protein RBG13Loki_1806 [Candidatus Lokiarchaeota archaeon CR_4]